MRSAEPLWGAGLLMLVQLALLQLVSQTDEVFYRYPLAVAAPAISGFSLILLWVAVREADYARFGQDAWLLRKLCVRIPRGLLICGVEAPERAVQGRTRRGAPFKVRLVKRRMRAQTLTGLAIWVPPGLTRSVLDTDLLSDAVGPLERKGASFALYEDARGDRGRWRFFHLLVFEIHEEEVKREANGAEEEGH